MHRSIVIAAAAALTAGVAHAYVFSTNLKTLAETVAVEGNTYVNVLGTGDAKPGNQWGWSKDVVFDGRVHTGANAWFEPTYNNGDKQDAWAGIHLSAPARVRKIRYFARNDGTEYAARAIGCRFQGANDVDFANPVTLHTIPPTDLDTLTNGWQEVEITDRGLLSQTFEYLRVIGDYGGNFCEVEFIGGEGPLAADAAPAAPELTSFAAINGSLSYGFTAGADAYAWRLERRFAGEDAYETLDESAFIDEGEKVFRTFGVYLAGPAEYRLVAVNLAGETAGESLHVAYTMPLGGSAIHSELDAPAANVFDGDIATHCKSVADGGWIGLDLGETRRVTGLRLVPEQGQGWRNEYDKVQVSDDSSFPEGGTVSSDSLNQSWSAGPRDTFVTNYTFAAMTGRYVRYISNSSRSCSAAEIEFLTDDYTPVDAPQNFAVAATMADVTLSWDLPAHACMTLRVVRTASPGGGTEGVVQIATDLRGDATTWIDTTTVPGVTYYYCVMPVNTIDGVEYAGQATETLAARRIVEIDTAGKSFLTHQTPWSEGQDAAALFDGNVWTDVNIHNGSNGSDGTKAGVDLGAAYVIDNFIVYAGYQENDGVNRSNYLLLGGSANTADWTDGVAISPQLGSIANMTERNIPYAFETTDKSAFRYVYLMSADGTDAYCNAAELRLFGYNADEAAAVLVAPDAARCAWRGAHVDILWDAASAAETYRIERSTDGGEWELVAENISVAAYRDNPPHPMRETYSYRIAAVDNSGNIAYTLAIVPAGVPAPRGLSITIR